MSKDTSLNPFKSGVHVTDGSSSMWEKQTKLQQTPHTQKASGVFFLMKNQQKIKNMFGWSVPKHYVFDSSTRFADYSFNFPVFARPCPIKPRHGFVDSILCENSEKLNALVARTEQEENEAEILVTKPIPSAYNVIINGNIVTFGCGNDGATAGKDCLYFYLNGNPLSNVLALSKVKPALIADNEMPFFELVINQHNLETNLVQVRSAPQMPLAKDYVPNKVEIKTVIKAEGDLLAWESKLKTVEKENTIIDHFGGTLSSHYAIHAIINKIPIMTTRIPVVGETIEQTVVDGELTEEEKNSFHDGFIIGFNSSVRVTQQLFHEALKSKNEIRSLMREIVKLALATLHNFSGISLARDYKLIGTVLGLFIRVAFAISYGEARYSSSHSFKEKIGVEEYKGNRIACYCRAFLEDRPVSEIITNIAVIYNQYRNGEWRSAYGGQKWANCTISAINLFNACMNKDIPSVVSLFNKLINAEHNGGKYLNKVISPSEFDYAAMDPSTYFLKNLTSNVDILYSIHATNKAYNFLSNKDQFTLIDVDAKPNKVLDKTATHDLYPQTLDILNGKVLLFGNMLKISEPVVPDGTYAVLNVPHWLSVGVMSPEGEVVSKKIISKAKYKTLKAKHEEGLANITLPKVSSISWGNPEDYKIKTSWTSDMDAEIIQKLQDAIEKQSQDYGYVPIHKDPTLVGIFTSAVPIEPPPFQPKNITEQYKFMAEKKSKLKKNYSEYYQQLHAKEMKKLK